MEVGYSHLATCELSYPHGVGVPCGLPVRSPCSCIQPKSHCKTRAQVGLGHRSKRAELLLLSQLRGLVTHTHKPNCRVGRRPGFGMTGAPIASPEAPSFPPSLRGQLAHPLPRCPAAARPVLAGGQQAGEAQLMPPGVAWIIPLVLWDKEEAQQSP